MTGPTHLDGNAIAGDLHAFFGIDMTSHRGCCGGCGTVRPMAEIRIYQSGPGTVANCPNCGQILLVIVTHGATTRVSTGVLRWIESPESD